MKKIILFGFFVVIFFISGCIEQGMEEIGNCMSKCEEVCQILENNEFDPEGFNNISIKKQSTVTGSNFSVECSCLCAGVQ